MLFKSDVDWWYYIVIVAVVVVVITALLPTLRGGQLPLSIATIILIASLALPVWLLFSTNYRVDTETLLIKSGPFSWVIPLNEIHSVRPSRSVISSPALSLNRLELTYGDGKSILVSPKNRVAFLTAIGHHTTDL